MKLFTFSQFSKIKKIMAMTFSFDLPITKERFPACRQL